LRRSNKAVGRPTAPPQPPFNLNFDVLLKSKPKHKHYVQQAELRLSESFYILKLKILEFPRLILSPHYSYSPFPTKKILKLKYIFKKLIIFCGEWGF